MMPAMMPAEGAWGGEEEAGSWGMRQKNSVPCGWPTGRSSQYEFAGQVTSSQPRRVL